MGHDDLDKEPKSSSLSETRVISQLNILEPDTILVGRFQILQQQGCGRFGCVYKALDKQLDSLVAIKVLHQHLLDESSLRNFKNEILILRQLSHSNIVRVHEYYHDNDIHFITMDWIEGQSLAELIQSGELKNSPNKTISYIKQILSALETTSEKGVTHRDLKPENILIDSNEQLYIADFGIASAVNQQTSQTISGTPLYAPPEYLQGGEVNNTTDIYAFGLILYEMLEGRLPYKAKTEKELISEKQKNSISISRTNKKYKALIESCLAPIVKNRPKNIGQIAAELHSNQPLDKKSYVTPLVAVISLIVLCIAIFYFFSDRLETPENNATDSESVQSRSIAVLPFEAKGLDNKVWISEGLPQLITQQLAELSDLRVINFPRTDKTIDLMGYQQPLDDQQLMVISDLLQTEVFIGTSIVSVGPTQLQVNSQLITVSGNSVQKSDLTSFTSAAEGLASNLNSIITGVKKRFDVEQSFEITPLPKNLSVEEVSKIDLLIEQQQLPRATEQLKQLLKKHPEYTEGWLLLGKTQSQADDVLEAEESFKQVISLSKPQAIEYQLASIELQLLTQNFTGAIKTYRSVLEQLPHRDDLRLELAQLYIEQQSLSEAEQELKVIVKDDVNHPVAWYELSKVAIWQGDTEEAVDNYLVKALVTAKKLKNDQLKGDVLNAFGVAYHRLGKLELSLDYYQQGLKARQSMNDSRGVVTSLSNLASVYAVKGNYAQAEANLLKALEVNKPRNDAEKQADLFNELGVIAEEQGLHRKALEQFRASLSIRMKLNDDWLKAESLNNVAYSYFMQSDEEHATIYWEQAKAYYQKVDDPVGVIRVNENMAQLQLQKGNWQGAYQVYTQALEQSKALNLFEEMIVARAYLAKIAFLHGNFKQPFSELEDIRSLLAERQDIRGQIEFGLWQAEWSITTGDFDGAKQLLKEVKPLLSEKVNRSQYQIYNVLRTRLNLLKGDLVESTLEITESFETLTSTAALKLLIQQYEVELLKSAPEEKTINAITAKVNNFDLELHRYLQLEYLLLEASYHNKTGQVDALKSDLDTLALLQRQLGRHWSRYATEHLYSVYYQKIDNSELANQHKLEAVKLFNELLKQLSEKQQQNFISIQGLNFFNDTFMEQVSEQ